MITQKGPTSNNVLYFGEFCGAHQPARSIGSSSTVKIIILFRAMSSATEPPSKGGSG